ncbi:MAG: PGPGW domain-containing protein [Pyrinomonadaceae bacterium]
MLRNVAGFALIAIGILGVFLPVIPGVVLIMAGAAILGTDHRAVRPFMKFLEKHRERRKRVEKVRAQEFLWWP